MNKTIIFCGLSIMLGCQLKKQHVAEVTFQVDMSEVIVDIEDPKTIGVVGSGPLEWKMTPLKEEAKGIFSTTLKWPVKDVDTIEYTFMHSHDIFDEVDIGVAAYRMLELPPDVKCYLS
jgi:hypothetical protein